MDEVYLTAREAATALGLSYYTITRYAGKGGKFPNAKLRDGSRRKGYRIPDTDVLAYAMAEGHDRLRIAEAAISKIRAAYKAIAAAS